MGKDKLIEDVAQTKMQIDILLELKNACKKCFNKSSFAMRRLFSFRNANVLVL